MSDIKFFLLTCTLPKNSNKRYRVILRELYNKDISYFINNKSYIKDIYYIINNDSYIFDNDTKIKAVNDILKIKYLENLGNITDEEIIKHINLMEDSDVYAILKQEIIKRNLKSIYDSKPIQQNNKLRKF